ncbi:hypothetical protein BEN48_15955 [Hymenobacter glacialis]|uniref:Uncharacterized protein n=1 Tax=Hymenobacter glacialis TaxID=1908236 RepID=A0A1G1T0X4_9BACT|nr:hypothetical protein BEN48_15955 [Hymenobacter glacialis]
MLLLLLVALSELYSESRLRSGLTQGTFGVQLRKSKEAFDYFSTRDVPAALDMTFWVALTGYS